MDEQVGHGPVMKIGNKNSEATFTADIMDKGQAYAGLVCRLLFATQDPCRNIGTTQPSAGPCGSHPTSSNRDNALLHKQRTVITGPAQAPQ